MGKDFKFGGATVALRSIATVDKGLHELVGQDTDDLLFQDDLVNASAIVENDAAYFCVMRFEFYFYWGVVAVLDNLQEFSE
jgi:hypothetical protein